MFIKIVIFIKNLYGYLLYILKFFIKIVIFDKNFDKIKL